MDIILYTTHCPMCKILEKKLASKNIKYNICEDVDFMINNGFTTLPMLKVDSMLMNFKEANTWINELEN